MNQCQADLEAAEERSRRGFAYEVDHHPAHSAAEALGRIGPAAAAAVPVLAAVVQSRNDNYVRFAAAEALGLIGPLAAPAVPALVAAVGDNSLHNTNVFDVRIAAARALGRIGPRRG